MTTTQQTETTPRYIVVPAPGHYGDRTRVISSHGTLRAAQRACRTTGACVRQSYHRAGDVWLRVYEEGSPIVYRRATGAA